MGEDIPIQIIESIERESERSQNDVSIAPSLSYALDSRGGEVPRRATVRKSKKEIKLDILESTTGVANYISDQIYKQEGRKDYWRKFFIIFFSVLLVISLTGVGFLIYFNSIGQISVSVEIIVGIFVNIIANIFSILYFMVKYINDTQYLKMFKIVSYKMLDFIVQDKKPYNTQNNKAQPSTEAKS